MCEVGVDASYGTKVAGFPAGQEKEGVEEGEGGGGRLVDACYNDYLGTFSMLLLHIFVEGLDVTICAQVSCGGKKSFNDVPCTAWQLISRMRSLRGWLLNQAHWSAHRGIGFLAP